MSSSVLGPLLCACLAGAGVTLTGASAMAQSAPPPAALQPTPDVVKLKDGSMYRGTILELVVGDHVELRLASGEVKRFAAADVTYAGAPPEPAPAPSPPPAPQAAAPAPSGPQPLVTLDATAAKLHFEATSPDIDFHIRTGEAVVGGFVGGHAYSGTARGYEHICTAPCVATLPTGTHRLALSQSGHAPIEPVQPTVVSGPATVRGTYVSHQGARVGGWLLLGASLGIGTGMVVASVQSTQDCSFQSATGGCTAKPSMDNTLLFGGIAVMAIGSLVSLILVLQHDAATIEVVPLDTSASPPSLTPKEAAWLAPATTAAQGLGLRVRF